MKKLFLSTTLLVGLLSIQAHADYVSPTTSVASQAAQYSVMDINNLIKAAKAGQPAAQFYLATKYQQGKDISADERQAFAWYKAAADQGLQRRRQQLQCQLHPGVRREGGHGHRRRFQGSRGNKARRHRRGCVFRRRRA